MSGPVQVISEPERLRQYGVIYDAAKQGRIGLSDGQRAWGDHLRIEFMVENKPGVWWGFHIDADTMEALAGELHRRAKYLRGR